MGLKGGVDIADCSQYSSARMVETESRLIRADEEMGDPVDIFKIFLRLDGGGSQKSTFYFANLGWGRLEHVKCWFKHQQRGRNSRFLNGNHRVRFHMKA